MYGKSNLTDKNYYKFVEPIKNILRNSKSIKILIESNISPDKFNSWQADFNKKVKPEVFAFDAMTPKQQQDFVTRKTKDGSLGAFRKDLTSMVQQGFIDIPGR
jgi:hypothetical protein